MTQPIPAGHEGMIPHLIVNGAAKAIEFYKKAFGAEEMHKLPAPDGKRLMHAALKIDGRFVFLADDFPEMCGGKASSPAALGATPVVIHRYVQDVDAAMQKAVDAGATLTMPAMDAFWGDRYGQVTDPFGHLWSLATHKQDLSPQQIAEGMRQAFAQQG